MQHAEERGDGVKMFRGRKKPSPPPKVDLDKLAAKLNDGIDYFWATNLPKTDDPLCQEMQNLTKKIALLAATYVSHGFNDLATEIILRGIYQGEPWRWNPETGKVFKAKPGED